jgi:hypothetical protein
MKSSWLIAVCMVAIAGCGARPVTTAGASVHREKLKADTMIQSYPCAKGYVWFYSNGNLGRCTVAKETPFGEAMLPAGSILVLHGDGSLQFALLKHDTQVAGVTCKGGNGLLGPSEDSMTTFYASGKLKQCWLAADQVVQGVPCMNGGFRGDAFGTGVEFYENGKLESCKLSKGYRTQPRGDRFIQAS